MENKTEKLGYHELTLTESFVRDIKVNCGRNLTERNAIYQAMLCITDNDIDKGSFVAIQDALFIVLSEIRERDNKIVESAPMILEALENVTAHAKIMHGLSDIVVPELKDGAAILIAERIIKSLKLS